MTLRISLTLTFDCKFIRLFCFPLQLLPVVFPQESYCGIILFLAEYTSRLVVYEAVQNERVSAGPAMLCS